MDTFQTIAIVGAGSTIVNGHYQRGARCFRTGNNEYIAQYWRTGRHVIDGVERDIAVYMCTDIHDSTSPWSIGYLRRVNGSFTFIILYQTNPLQQPARPPQHGWQPVYGEGEIPSPTLHYLVDLYHDDEEQEAAISAGDDRFVRRLYVRNVIQNMRDVTYMLLSEYQRQRALAQEEEEDDDDDEPSCPICIREIDPASTVAVLRCQCYPGNNHQHRVLHSRCIEADVMRRGGQRLRCPVCRVDII